MLTRLNFYILFAKQFIRKCHKNNIWLNFEAYLKGLKNSLERLTLLEEKFIELWNDIYVH